MDIDNIQTHNLANKNIVITGASKGIGKALAMAFASQGANLMLCARNEAALFATRVELLSLYPTSVIKAKACDLSIKADVVAFGDWVLVNAATVDILINNAGVFIPGNIYDEGEGVLEKMIATNLYSAYHLTRTLVTQMIANHHGHIFNICSIASLKAYANGGSYSISKYAMAGFNNNLRQELMPHGIKVTGVYPGAVLTDSWKGFDNTDGRIMEASDVAVMIVAACKLSPQAVAEDILLRPLLGDL